MPNIQICIINRSSVVQDKEIAATFPDLQTQVRLDFALAWGIDAKFIFAPTGEKSSAGSWRVVILDDSDVAAALGYHDVPDEGSLLGKVFAGTDKINNLNGTITARHELLEMVADREINLTVYVRPDANFGTLYVDAVCDPCEHDSIAYIVGATLISDFVFPTYFETARPAGSTRFDHQQKLAAPVPAILAGGYLQCVPREFGHGIGPNHCWRSVRSESARDRRVTRRQPKGTPRPSRGPVDSDPHQTPRVRAS